MTCAPIRIGLFGGTFDPIHVGHLTVASGAMHELKLERVLFVVAHRPWQKVGKRSIAPSKLRLAMVEAATNHRDDFVASGIEIERGGESYTIDTVEAMTEAGTQAGELHQYVLVVGSDVAEGLDTWHRHQELRELVELAVIDRPGDEGAEPPTGWRYERVSAPLVNLSSSMLRTRMAADQPVEYLVPRSAMVVYNEWRSSLEGRDDPDDADTSADVDASIDVGNSAGGGSSSGGASSAPASTVDSSAWGD